MVWGGGHGYLTQSPFPLLLRLDAGLAPSRSKAFIPSVIVLGEFFLVFIGSLLWEDLGRQCQSPGTLACLFPMPED